MIPELAFSDRAALPVTDVRHVRDRLEALMPKTMEFAVLGDRSYFASKKADLTINGMTLVALSHTPYQLDRNGCIHPEIWIPMSGHMDASDGRTKFTYGGLRGYFCTSETRNIRTTTVSALGLRFDLRRLNAVHAAMIGAPSVADLPAHSRLVDLEANGIHFLNLVRNLLRQIDELQANAAVLERMAMDDALYRLIVAMMKPELLLSRDSDSGPQSHSQERIRRLCEYLRANLT